MIQFYFILAKKEIENTFTTDENMIGVIKKKKKKLSGLS